MNNVVADIYIVLSVATIILFILTRKTSLRIKKLDKTTFSLGFSLFKIEVCYSGKPFDDAKLQDTMGDGEISASLNEIFSLLTLLLRYFKKCSIEIRHLALPLSIGGGFYSYFGFRALISAIIAYIESNVEKLTIRDNAFILSSDQQLKFDIDLKITLFNLVVLITRLIINVIKIERLEKANVGN
jgi:hypothetical protein